MTASQIKRLSGWAILIALPILVHWPAWSGWLSPDPLQWISGLTQPVWMPQGVLPGYPFIDANAGVTTQALGTLAAREWVSGTVPWWNPFSGIGLPLAGEMQPAAFFLPFVLLLLLPSGVLWLKMTMQIIAGCGTFALLRQLGVGRSSALVGAVLFELNGVFAWVAHAPILPIAFLPLLLLGIERAGAAAQARTRAGWRWITVAIAYSLLAGFPEVAYLDGMLALCWAFYRGVALPPDARLTFLRKILWGGMLGLLPSAPLLVSFGDFLRDGYVGGHGDFAHRGLAAPNSAMLLIPYIAGTVGGHIFWFTTGGYVGLASVFLSMVAMLRPGKRSGLRMLLAGWLVLTFGKAADLPGITWAINQVPLVDQTMFSNYIAPSWSMALSILAAFGLDDCRRGALKMRRVVALALVLTGALLSAALLADSHQIFEVWATNSTTRTIGIVSIVWVLALTTGLAVLCVSSPCARREVLLRGLLATDAIAMFTAPLLAGVRPQAPDMGAVTFLRNNLGLQRFYAIDTITPNYGAMFGLASVNYNYLPNARLWVDHVRANLDDHADAVNFVGRAAALRANIAAYQAIGVRYVVAARDADPGVGRRVFRDRSTDIYELPNPAKYFESSGAACRLDADGREALRTVCPAPATLIRRELFLNGWTVYVNGRKLAVTRSGLFQVVALPEGPAEIRFAYRPPWTASADAGLICGAVCFGLSLIRRDRLSWPVARKRCG